MIRKTQQTVKIVAVRRAWPLNHSKGVVVAGPGDQGEAAALMMEGVAGTRAPPIRLGHLEATGAVASSPTRGSYHQVLATESVAWNKSRMHPNAKPLLVYSSPLPATRGVGAEAHLATQPAAL